MSEVTATTMQLPDFVDLEFARRLEMAEMILPDCVEAIRRYAPDDPNAAENIAGGIAFFGGVKYPANQIVGMGLYGAVNCRGHGSRGAFLPQPRRAFYRCGLAPGGRIAAQLCSANAAIVLPNSTPC